jgi:hypothetical protein
LFFSLADLRIPRYCFVGDLETINFLSLGRVGDDLDKKRVMGDDVAMRPSPMQFRPLQHPIQCQ